TGSPRKWRTVVLLFVGGAGVLVLSFWGTLTILDYLSSAISTEFIRVDQAVNLLGVDVQLEIIGAWTVNGHNPEAGPVPLSGTDYGSWSGNDANTGTLTYSGISLKYGPVFLPFATGPNTDNQTIQLVDTGTGKIISTIRPPVQKQWVLLK